MSSSAVPNLHIDANGNIRRGPPLSIPMVIGGSFGTTMGSNGTPYVNPVGNESQIPAPISGYNIMARGEDAMYNPEIEREPVGQGDHYGHVVNDYNAQIDSRAMSGITQIPSQNLFNLLYQPYTAESSHGNMFSTQLPPPPGAPHSERAAQRLAGLSAGRPRIPGVGGVGPVASQYERAGGSSSRRAEKGRSVSIYDEGAPEATKKGGPLTSSANLAKARLYAGAGVGNNLEMTNPQGQNIMTREKKRDKKKGHKRVSGGISKNKTRHRHQK